MAEKNKIEVFIGGKVYKILGEESEEYLQKVARYIDKKMMEINGADRPTVINSTMLSVLTSINVADDFFKMKEKNEILIKKIEESPNKIDNSAIVEKYEQELGKLEKENMALRDKLDQVILELLNAKNELNDYIETFDLNGQDV